MHSLLAKVGQPTKRKGMGCLGMQVAPFDSTCRGQYDEPDCQPAEMHSFLSTWGGGLDQL